VKYTEKIHAEGLLIIFSEIDTCHRCPASRIKAVMGVTRWDGKHRFNMPQCDICWDFIGAKSWQDGWGKCPCSSRNQERAARRTWLALEEKGYIQ